MEVEAMRKTKLNWKVVTEIREHYAGDRYTAPQLAKKYKISETLVYSILKWEVWNPEKT